MITRTIFILSLVSLFADIASEMLYPVMPLYLKHIGFSAIGLGLLEGLANATAALSKGYFGYWSDITQRRMPFVRWGYALSALSKPLTIISTATIWVLAVRTTDRLGKGIRTAPRDAILAAESAVHHRGTVFGFHRAFDTLGAALGPALALYLLHLYPKQYALVFIIAVLPGLVSVLFTFAVRDANASIDTVKPNSLEGGSPFRFLGYWTKAPAAYKRIAILAWLFAAVNSADAFLLLRLHQIGCSDAQVIGAYMFFNLIFAMAAYPLGKLGDWWGMKPTYLCGLALFGGVYIGMVWVQSWWGALCLLLGYGIYAAATESLAKAWISRLCPPDQVATGVGLYAAVTGVATFAASLWTGFVWHYCGATAAFAASGIAAIGLAVAGIFLLVEKDTAFA